MFDPQSARASDECPGIACRGRILQWLSARIDNPDDAEDIAGEICVHCRHGIGRFRRDAEFETWLHRVAMNALIDYIRKRARRSKRETELTIDMATTPASPAQNIDVDAASRHIREAICKLSPRHRHVIEWKYGDCLTYAEIAARLNISVNAASQALYRARAALRKAVDAQAPETN